MPLKPRSCFWAHQQRHIHQCGSGGGCICSKEPLEMCVSGEKTQSSPPHPDTQVAHWHFPSILYICNCKAEKHQQGALQEGSDYREGSRLSCSSLSLASGMQGAAD